MSDNIQECKKIIPELKNLLLNNEMKSATLMLKENYLLIINSLMELLKECEKENIQGLSIQMIMNEIKVLMDACQNEDIVLLTDCIGYEIDSIMKAV